MSEPNDKQLHEWVRQSLDAYRPEYNPQDWQRLQRAVRRRRWWRIGAAGLLGLVLIGLTGWWFVETYTTNEAAPAASVIRPKAVKSTFSRDKSVEPSSLSHRSNAFLMPVTSAKKSKSRGTAPAGIKRFSLPVIDVVMPRNEITPLQTNFRRIPIQSPMIAYSLEETAITHQMLTGKFGSDSTSYKALNRNIRQWPDAVVVCDLTTSMYPYSTQLYAWFKRNARNPAIKGLVFFTDCDSLGQETRAGSLSGKMFVTRERDPDKALPVMLAAARNTVNNYEGPENDIAALLHAQDLFPEAKHLILLADNTNSVKDMDLLKKLHKPVHVVLCGTTWNDTQAFQPDYYTIANHTQGSLHTIEDDLRPGAIPHNAFIRVSSHYYRYNSRKKQFKLTRFRIRPIEVLGLFRL